MIYEPNPKHKEPWQPGRTGSLCPKSANPRTLMKNSVLHKKKRYATDGERAYCAKEHAPEHWHGWPVGWREVPPEIRWQWISAEAVSRGNVKKHWEAGT
ncbi:MAG: hypothetical protein ACLFV4_14610 [Candidatus Hydrogenedentota bacterium]